MPKIGASGILCCGPGIFVSAAWILSIFANSRCYLLRLDDGNSAKDTFWTITVKSIGLWCVEDERGNYWDIRDANLDSKYSAARGLGTTASVIGFCLWLFYCFAGCFRFGPNVFRIVGFFAVCNCIFQSLVFLLQKSAVCNEGCGLDTGGNCAIAAAVLYFVGGVMSCGVGKEVAEAEAARDGGDGGEGE